MQPIDIRDELNLLLSLALNYPILSAWGYTLKHPIACVIQTPEEAEAVLRYLQTFQEKKIITANSSAKQVKRLLEAGNSEFIFFYYYDCPQMKNYLQQAIVAIQTGSSRSSVYSALPFVFFYPAVPDHLKSEFFLYFPTVGQELRREGDYIQKMLEFLEGQLPMIKDRIESLPKRNSYEGTLKASACFLLPLLKSRSENFEEDFQKFLLLCEGLCKKNEEAQDESGIVEAFTDLFYEYIQCAESLKACHRAKVWGGTDATELLFDQNFIYVTEGLFRDIVRPLRDMLSEPLIKETLKKEGVLCCNNEKTYTVKVWTCNVYGATARIRMLKFRGELLNRMGDISLLDLMESWEDQNGIG